MQAYRDDMRTTVGDMEMLKVDEDPKRQAKRVNELMQKSEVGSVRIFELLPQLRANLKDAVRKMNVKEFDGELKSLIKQSFDISQKLKDLEKEDD